SQPVARPVAVFSAAAWLRAAPPAEVNSPPDDSVVPSDDIDRAYTAGMQAGSSGVARLQPATFPFQAVATPVVASRAARPTRVAPPAVVKSPPAKTVLPSGVRASARTAAPAPGFQAVAAPVVASRAASRERPAPPAVVKSPPTRMSPPRCAMARTAAPAPGFHPGTRSPAPVAATAARRLRATVPTAVKSPPRKTCPAAGA